MVKWQSRDGREVETLDESPATDRAQIEPLEVEDPATPASTEKAPLPMAYQFLLAIVYMLGAMGMNFFMKFVLSKITFATASDPPKQAMGLPGPFFWTSTQQILAFICAISLVGAYECSNGKVGYKLPKLTSSAAVKQVVVLAGCFAMNMGLNNFSLSLVNITINNMIRSTSPFSTAVCATIFFGKGMTFEEWAFLALGVAFSLCAVLGGGSLSEGTANDFHHYVIGVVAAFASTLGGALMFIVAELMGSSAVKLNAIDSMCYMSLPASIFLVPFFFAMPHAVPEKWSSSVLPGKNITALTDIEILEQIDDSRLWLFMVASGACAAIYNGLQFFAVQKLSSTQTAFASNISKAFTVLIDAFFIRKFHNTLHDWLVVLSSAGGIICFTLFSFAKQRHGSDIVVQGNRDDTRRKQVSVTLQFIALTGVAGILCGLAVGSKFAMPPSSSGTSNSAPRQFSKEIPTELGRYCWRSKPTPGLVVATYVSGDYAKYIPTLQRQVDTLQARLLVFGPDYFTGLNDVPVCDTDVWDSSQKPCVPPMYKGTQCFEWKSLTVQQALLSLRQHEDVLLYMDVRTLISGDLSLLVNYVRKHGSVFYGKIGIPAQRYVKREVWEYLGFDPREADTQTSYRISGGVFAISKANPAIRSAMTNWALMSEDPYLLCNSKNRKGHDEYDGFKTHQHDQAVLTAICMNMTRSQSRCEVLEADVEGTFLTPNTLQSHLSRYNISCGFIGSCMQDHECRQMPCHDEHGLLADRLALPEAVSMMSRHMFGKKIRVVGRGEAFLSCSTTAEIQS
eukprot:TRINITY_DN87847_c0_g1_i1.p1 TRINITY_DN87847_c0_g1~~TRINITY_DN87847_c0_g1_i1.p1  ORF type:complete len:792 (-),score=89.51 TRINITY_DN87847_c0_g1_i1:257-2632(-)